MYEFDSARKKDDEWEILGRVGCVGGLVCDCEISG